MHQIDQSQAVPPDQQNPIQAILKAEHIRLSTVGKEEEEKSSATALMN